MALLVRLQSSPPTTMTYNTALVQTADTISNNTTLPLAVGVLWCYAMRQAPDFKDKFKLSDVVYRKGNIVDQAKQLSQNDIVCFSCYLWNFRYHMALASEIKMLNPNIYLVFGGPAIVPTDPGFWLLHKNYVDLALQGECEDSFVQVLQQFPNIDKQSIPGSFGPSWTSDLPERRKSFTKEDSPYVMGFFDKIIDEIVNRGEFPHAVIQTNRGCPYHCSFCESGADYKNKLHLYDYDRVCAEFEWCSLHGVHSINLADDNFGIVARDVDILQHAIDLKAKYGYPQIVFFLFTKSSPERVALMSDMMITQKADFIKSASISLQSLNEETLKAVKRYNISEVKQQKLIDHLNSIGMSTYVELIWPLPYETYETFCKGIDTLYEKQLANWISVYALGVPPGTDMGIDFADSIKLAEQKLPTTTKFDGSLEEMVFQVYETNWATHDEVVRGHVFATWMSVLYFFGFGKYFIDQLIKEKNTTLSTVINQFIDYANCNKSLLVSKWTDILSDTWSNRLRGLPIKDVSIFPNDDTTHWHYFTHLASWINQNRNQFYAELKTFAIEQELNDVDFIFDILPDSIIKQNQIYPYTRTVNGRTIQVNLASNFLAFGKEKFNSEYEFGRFYYFWKRQSGWHRTVISIQ